MEHNRILIAEDEDIARENLEHILVKDGYQVTAVNNGTKALQQLEASEFELVITDLKMPDINGLQLLDSAKNKYPEIEVLVVTGYATVTTAVEAMHKGAFSYLPKPFNFNELRILVERALEKRSLHREISQLKKRINEPSFSKLIGQSAKIKSLKKTISQISAVDCNVLIYGETGTGKELVAKSIHGSSPRSKNRFMAINCAAFTEELLGNELFGHESGAFTGAKNSKKGLLEVADGGTFFLDEIGDMQLSMQAKLLRVLEEGTLIKLGGTTEIPVDLRILAATNKDLKQEVENGSFRKDLYYRLNVINLLIPPLNERKEDIPLLSYYFLSRYNKAMDKPIDSIAEDVIQVLLNYEFPGNVRELENIIERAVVMCDGKTIMNSHLPSDLRTKSIVVKRMTNDRWVTLADYEKDYIKKVLKHTNGNKTKASHILGIDRVSLWRKINRYYIESDE